MSFQWWCVAQGQPWTWTWQAYPGVWLVVAAVGAVGWRLIGRGDRGASDGPGRRHRLAAWGAGTFVLWAALDWPLGPLGASYLASVHMVQYLMVGLVAPALLLLGVPAEAWASLARRRRLMGFLGPLTNPLSAAVVFNAGMTVTHWPGVVDALRVSQLGSFVMDAAWLACGLVFWWPLLAPVPERPRFHPLLRVAYLFVNAVVMTPPALMLLFSRSPVYGVYELAPPLLSSPVLWDQQLAGSVMKVGCAAVMAVAAGFVLRGWVVRERILEAERV